MTQYEIETNQGPDSTQPTSSVTTDAFEVALAVVAVVPLLIGFVALKELQKKMPKSDLLFWLVGKPWVSE